MQELSKSILKAGCMSLALLGATAVVTVMIAPDTAYAGSEKSKGKAKGKGKAKKAKHEDKNNSCDEKEFKGKGGVAAEIGMHPCALGNMNSLNGKSGKLDDLKTDLIDLGTAIAVYDKNNGDWAEPTCDEYPSGYDCYWTPSLSGDTTAIEQAYEDALNDYAAISNKPVSLAKMNAIRDWLTGA